MARFNRIKIWFGTLLLVLVLPTVALAQDLDLATQLEAALSEALVARTAWSADQISISNLSVPARITKAKGFQRILLPSRETLVGHLPFKVEIKSGTGRELVWASARVEVLVDAIVASRVIGRHQVIRRGDLARAQMPLSRTQGGVASEFDAVVGQRALQRIAQGRAISERMVESPPVVHRGDRVTLLVRRPGLTVTTVGEAREDGAPNHTIRVMNLGSRRMVRGKVVDAGTVEVMF